MKTKFTTIIAVAALLLSLNVKADNGAVELGKVGTINKIEASGNVDVYLVNGDYDAVKVYDDFYGQNAVVKNVDGVLHIASYATEKLVVMVTVSDLQEITANDNASFKTYGEALQAKSIEVNVNDNASAQLKIDALAADVNVKGEASAEMAGKVENYQLNYSSGAKVNTDDLETYASRKTKIEQPKYNHFNPSRFALHTSL